MLKMINYLSQFGDPEQFHETFVRFLKYYQAPVSINKPTKDNSVLKWKNPIGLAAGFDKNGDYLNELDQVGFGALEVGTVTPLSQAGNLKPRIKKLNHSQSLLNWMGFPSMGVKTVSQNLKNYRGNSPLGINIGKNKNTPNNKAIDDYLTVAKELKAYAQYFVINVSSPNTPGLRDLQKPDFLKELTSEFKRHQLSNLFIKIAPDLNKNQLDELSKIENISGFIATNTSNNHHFGKGGLSGKSISNLSYQTSSYLWPRLKERGLEFVACGGISQKEDIIRYQELGITTFQIYSSFIYQGPKIIKKLLS